MELRFGCYVAKCAEGALFDSKIAGVYGRSVGAEGCQFQYDPLYSEVCVIPQRAPESELLPSASRVIYSLSCGINEPHGSLCC